MSEPVDLTQALGDLLDIHLSQSLKRWKRIGNEMRGVNRLADVAQRIFKELDSEADLAADELLAAKAESATVVAGYRQVAGDIREGTKAALNTLNQLTNGIPLPDGSGSNG